MIMRGCRHPNVLQFLGAGTNPPNICIGMCFLQIGVSIFSPWKIAVRMSTYMIFPAKFFFAIFFPSKNFYYLFPAKNSLIILSIKNKHKILKIKIE